MNRSKKTIIKSIKKNYKKYYESVIEIFLKMKR